MLLQDVIQGVTSLPVLGSILQPHTSADDDSSLYRWMYTHRYVRKPLDIDDHFLVFQCVKAIIMYVVSTCTILSIYACVQIPLVHYTCIVYAMTDCTIH